MKTLTTRATDLSARRELRPVPLVVLTTYTDRGAGTVDTIYRWSNRTVYYDYANTTVEQEFGAFLMGIDPLVQSMNHIPTLDANAFDRQLTIRLANIAVDGGSRLYEILEGKRLLFATVEIAQILMDPGKRETLADVRLLTGAEHQVWYRGEVIAHGADEEQIQLACQATARNIPWIVANAPTTNDPLDVGRRLPIVYGTRTRVPAVSYTVGWVTTLAQFLGSLTTGNVEFTDVSGLSGTGISVMIGSEEVLADFVDSKTLDITARAQNGTAAVAHGIGTTLQEVVSTVTFVVAGHAVSAIDEFYLQNPLDGTVTRITDPFTKTISDSSTISGKTVASVSFTAAQLKVVMDKFAKTASSFSSTYTTRQQPWTCVPSWGGLDGNKACDGQALEAVAGAAQVNNARELECFFRDIGLFDTQLVRVAASGAGTMTVKIGSVTIGTAAMTGSQTWYEFVTSEQGHQVDITNSNATGSQVYEVERHLPITTTETPDSGISAEFVESSTSTPNVIDGDTGTSHGFSGALQPMTFEVEFAAPAITYYAQRCRIWLTTTATTRELQLIVDGVDADKAMTVGNNGEGTWLEFETEKQGDTIRFSMPDTTQFSCFEIERVLLSHASTLDALAFGFGLRAFADLSGPLASGGFYTVGNGTLIDHPADILRHVIADLCGFGQGAIDGTTFAALATSSGVGSTAKLAPILNDLGENFGDVIQRIAYECRANLVQEESATATVFKVYAASTAWAWGASERTIDAYLRLSSESRDGSQVATRFRALYAPDLSKDDPEQIWTKALRAGPDVSDLASLTTANLVDAEEDFGRRDHPGFAFASVYLDATAVDLATYYGKEMSRDARVIRVEGIPWWLAYDLERGSIVSITPRWSASAFKCRVVGYTKNFGTELVDATLVEVA